MPLKAWRRAFLCTLAGLTPLALLLYAALHAPTVWRIVDGLLMAAILATAGYLLWVYLPDVDLPGRMATSVISDNYWTTRFARDAQIATQFFRFTDFRVNFRQIDWFVFQQRCNIELDDARIELRLRQNARA